jgi:colanic acid/amylovoran biosynthesis glycosyltransferase
VFASKALANIGSFPFDRIYALSKAPMHVSLSDRAVRKRLGYSPFFSSVAEHEHTVILHAHGGQIATFVAGTAQCAGIPMIVSFYGTDMWTHPQRDIGLRRKYAEVFRVGAAYLAEGPAAAAQLVRIGCPEERIVIHRLGVDVAAIPFNPRSLADGRTLKVLMASRFAEKKGIPWGVEGFCRVARDNHQMQLTIVGYGGSSRDEKTKHDILKTARHYGVSDRVKVFGFMSRDALLGLANQHHILLHPSVQASTGDSEGGHPVVMTMMAANGMPILATRHCDIPEIVRHNETGWLVAERNADQIEATLRRIVCHPSMLSAFGTAARKLVEAKYDIRASRLDSVYDRILPGA